MDKISVVCPCYNEEECLPLFYEETVKALRAFSVPVDYEFIFVDDGSKDNTLPILRDLAKQDAHVRYISFSRNFGKEAAIYAGLKAAEGDCVTLMDADLQDPPSFLTPMYDGITKEGYDCVGCRRTTRKSEPKLRSAFAHLFYKLINKVTTTEIVDGARDFRMMTRQMVNAVLSLPEKDRFSKELFSWVGFRTKWLEYENIERAKGASKWSFRKLTRYAVGGIESATDAPLKINLLFAALFFLAGFVFAVIDIVFAATGTDVSATLILLPVLFVCLSFLFLGIYVVSDYVKKIFTNVKSRPLFIVKETDKDQTDGKN